MQNYSRVEKLTPFTGNSAFSNFIYAYRAEANDGFTFIDIDVVLRNYRKQTYAIMEIKCKEAPLSYAQGKIFNEIDASLKRGTPTDWTYVGFYLLQFENTCFDDGKAWLNGNEMTAEEFKFFLKLNF